MNQLMQAVGLGGAFVLGCVFAEIEYQVRQRRKRRQR